MKTFLSIILFVAASTQLNEAQTIQTIVVPQNHGADFQQNIPVLAGETFEVLSWGGSPAQILKVDGTQFQYGPLSSGTTGAFSYVVAGPKTVTLEVPANVPSVFTYKLSTNSAVATQNVASTTVVIPANAAAPVDIILESSTDLITWTAALPGSSSADTAKRFFRVRALAH